ncbi:hypothetical protein PG994_004353 [Apiospora phragmitis]|uniref:Uncharacterized protein n=1 Tax=Apiospora phragmitis TaxID=2905665 RepID=A0ABR1VQD1_9PEZI
MPAVSRPLQQVKTNVVAQAIESSSPPRLAINLAFLVVCLSLMVVYYFKFSSWNRSLLARHLLPTLHPDDLKKRFWEQSRGIGITKPTMPTNQSSNADRLKGGKKARPRHADNIPYWPQREGDEVRDGSPGGAPAEKNIPLKFTSRPPPPPPMTPLAIETGPYYFQERRHSGSVSISGETATPFYQHQNPDYSAGSSTSSTALPGFEGSPTSSRRRSYTKTLSLGSPQGVSAAELDATISSFTPHSFPSSNPMLPPPPHGSFSQDEIEVHGEVISVTDDAGMGWRRHTRVCGGGVCLACLASGGEEGGFYALMCPLRIEGINGNNHFSDAT